MIFPICSGPKTLGLALVGCGSQPILEGSVIIVIFEEPATRKEHDIHTGKWSVSSPQKKADPLHPSVKFLNTSTLRVNELTLDDDL